MKKRILSLIVALSMLISIFSIFSISVSAASTPSDWAVTEVNAATSEGLVTDKVTKDYQKAITREEFCELVVKLYEKLTGEKSTVGNDPFSDTDNTEILKAYSLGIVNGVSETEFAPDNTITRQEMCVMLVRAVETILGDEFILKYDFYKFEDSRYIADWAFEQVYYAYEKGIVKGVGNNQFSPLGTATCEQAILMVYRLHENIDKCRDTIPQEVVKRYENYTDVNNAFKEIEKKYTDENGYAAPDRIVELLDEIYSQAILLQKENQIEKVKYNEKYYNICCVLESGMKYLYTPPIEGLASRGKEIDVLSFDNLSAFESIAPNTLETVWKNLNIFDGMDGIVNFGSYGNIIKSSVGCNSNRYLNQYDKDYSVNDYKYLLSTLDPDNKQVLLWRGHGDLWDDDSVSYACFCVNADVTDEIKDFYILDKENKHLVWGDDYVALTPMFFEEYLSEVNGGMFYSGACYSAADGGIMADVFLDKGFTCYLGSSHTIVNIYSDVMMHSVVKNLCQYEDETQTIPISKALKMAQEEHGETEWETEWKVYNLFAKENLTGSRVLLAQNGDSDFRLIEPGFKTVDYNGEYIGDSRYYLSGGTLYKETDGKKTSLVSGITGNNILTNGKEVYYGTKDLKIKYRNLKDNTEKIVHTETVPSDIKAQWSYNGDLSDFSINIVGVKDDRLFFYLDHAVGAMYLKGIDISTGSAIFLRDNMRVEDGEMVNNELVLFPYRRDAEELLNIYSLNMDSLAINNIGNECFFNLKSYKNGICYWVVSYLAGKYNATLMYYNFDNNIKNKIYHVDNVDMGYFSYGKNTATYSVKNKKHTLKLDDLIK